MARKHDSFQFTILTDLKGADLKMALERVTRRLKAVGLPFQIADAMNVETGQEWEESELLTLLGLKGWAGGEGDETP